jgi:hypothetical protein
MEKDRVLELWCMLMEGRIKENGVGIWGMEKGLRNLRMAHRIKVGMSMANLKGMEDISGKTDKFMKVSGKMA